MKLLIERGANVNATFDYGRTIYQMGQFPASSEKDLASLKQIAKDANLETLHENRLGRLDLASSEEIKKLLVKNGAKSFRSEAAKTMEELQKLLGGSGPT